MVASSISTVLTIAGSDPSGGAGIQADLKTFTALGSYGMSVLTSLTSQNTKGVRSIESLKPSFVREQIDALNEDIRIDALKTGMLDNVKGVEETIRGIEQIQSKSSRKVPIVVDPVMVSTSGHTLLSDDAIELVREKLIPLCDILTPNLPEAECLVNRVAQRGHLPATNGKVTYEAHKHIDSIANMKDVAVALSGLGPSAVLLKGGHHTFTSAEISSETQGAAASASYFVTRHDQPKIIRNASSQKDPEDEFIVDILYIKATRQTIIYSRAKVQTTSTHGTGCTLSAALATYLAQGHSIIESVTKAIRYTQDGIATGLALGSGHGPLNHMHNIAHRALAHSFQTTGIPQEGQNVSFNLASRLITEASKNGLWQSYIHHPFVKQLGKGTLAEKKFVHFLRQDYKFLLHYARIHSLGAYKARNFQELEEFQSIVHTILKERKTHVKFCQSFGIDPNTLDDTVEDEANVAYTRWVMDIAMSRSILDLRVATAACLLGYGEAALLLEKTATEQEGVEHNALKNPYWAWVESYTSQEYQDAVRLGMTGLEKSAEEDPLSLKRYLELVNTFKFAIKLEIAFWDAAMRA